MRQKKIVIILLFNLMVFTMAAQYSKSDFRVVGYYYIRDLMSSPNTIPFKLNRLTHVNLAFLAPDSLGNFNQDFSSLKHFIKRAHRNNVKVLFSIDGHPFYRALLQDDKRSMLVQNFLSLVLKYNLDGIDVDIENDDLDNNYEAFVVELASALRLHQKLITAALQYKPSSVMRYTDNTLAQYDFINIMSYDHNELNSDKRPGPHSSYDNSVADLDIYIKGRKIPKEKLTLGVPFYGYVYGPDMTNRPYRPSMTYKEIVSKLPGAEFTDSLKNMPGGKSVFYNGIPTIKQKTTLAKEKASGIMIWQLGADARGSKSLLRAINETVYKKK
jgi:chitinase